MSTCRLGTVLVSLPPREILQVGPRGFLHTHAYTFSDNHDIVAVKVYDMGGIKDGGTMVEVSETQ